MQDRRYQPQYVNPLLPEGNQRQIQILHRELWKKTMHGKPDVGGMWSIYLKIGDEYRQLGFPQDALREGYYAAMKLCDPEESNRQLEGQAGLRKFISASLKAMEALIMQRSFPEARKCHDRALKFALSLKNPTDRMKYLLKLHSIAAEMYQAQGKIQETIDQYQQALETVDANAQKRSDIFIKMCNVYQNNCVNPELSVRFACSAVDAAIEAHDCDVVIEAIGTASAAFRQAKKPMHDLLDKFNKFMNSFVDPNERALLLIEKAKLFELELRVGEVVNCLQQAQQMILKAKKETRNEETLDYISSSLSSYEEAMMLAAEIKSVKDLALNPEIAREQKNRYEKFEEQSLSGDWAFAYELIDLLTYLIGNDSDSSDNLRWCFEIGRLYEIVKLNHEAIKNLRDFIAKSETQDDVENVSEMIAQAYFHLGNALESISEPIDSVLDVYSAGLAVAESTSNTEIQLQLLDNMEYVSLKWGRGDLANNYGAKIELLRDPDSLKRSPIKIPKYPPPRPIVEHRNIETNGENFQPHNTSIANVKSSERLLFYRIIMYYEYEGVRAPNHETITIPQDLFKSSTNWLKDQAQKLFKEKHGLDPIISHIQMESGDRLDSLESIIGMHEKLIAVVTEYKLLPLSEQYQFFVKKRRIMSDVDRQIVSRLAKADSACDLSTIVMYQSYMLPLGETVVFHLNNLHSLNLKQVLMDDLDFCVFLEPFQSQMSSSLASLDKLDLSYNQLTTSSFMHLADHLSACSTELLKITHLDISGTILQPVRRGLRQSAIPSLKRILQIQTLQSLSLNRCQLGANDSETDWSSLKNVEDCRLTSIYLRDNQLSETSAVHIVTMLMSLSKLENLDLSLNDLSSVSEYLLASFFDSFPKLKNLNLFGCNLKDNIPLQNLGSCHFLQSLNLGLNDLDSGTAAEGLKSLVQTLSFVDLHLLHTKIGTNSDLLRLIERSSSLKSLSITIQNSVVSDLIHVIENHPRICFMRITFIEKPESVESLINAWIQKHPGNGSSRSSLMQLVLSDHSEDPSNFIM